MTAREYPKTREDWEARQRVSYFTTCVFQGCGQYGRKEHPTEADAEAWAQEIRAANPHSRPVMIYAVTDRGDSIHLRNI